MARGRQQRTVRDRLIPREVWEADEARRRARRDRGVDSDESTVNDENEANDRTTTLKTLTLWTLITKTPSGT